MIQGQLAWERPCPRSPPSPWLSSGTTRERIPSESRTFHREVGSSRSKLSLSSSELTSSPQSEGVMKPPDKPSAPSTSPSYEFSLPSSELSSSRESEAVVAQHASVAVEETPA